MSIGSIIIGGGIDTGLFSGKEELIYRLGYFTKVISVTSTIQQSKTGESPIMQEVEKTSIVMTRYT